MAIRRRLRRDAHARELGQLAGWGDAATPVVVAGLALIRLLWWQRETHRGGPSEPGRGSPQTDPATAPICFVANPVSDRVTRTCLPGLTFEQTCTPPERVATSRQSCPLTRG